MALLTLSKATSRLFKMVSGTALKAAASPIVKFSKAATAFVTPSGVVTELANGWYYVSMTTGDANTIGDLAWYITGTACDDTDFVDQVVAFDPTDSAALGLSRLDAAVSTRLAAASTAANFSTFSIDASGRIDVSKWVGTSVSTNSAGVPLVDLILWRGSSPSALNSGTVQSDVERYLNTVVTVNSAGVPLTDVILWRGSSPNALIAGRIDANAQVVGDKTGYSLTQSFPSNFSVLSIDAAGRVDVGKFSGFAVDSGSTNRPTVNVDFVRSSSVNVLIAGRVDANAQVVGDKTGYSLTQTFPTNFSSLSIDANGRVLYANTVNLLKNTAFTSFPFFMVDSSDHLSPRTGATINAQRSLAGAAFGACANTAAEIGNGWYQINFAAGDLNASSIAFRFVGTGCDVTNIGVVPNV